MNAGYVLPGQSPAYCSFPSQKQRAGRLSRGAPLCVARSDQPDGYFIKTTFLTAVSLPATIRTK